MEPETLDAFEEWWHNEVEAYATAMNLPIHYVEEEFVLDGELIKI